MYVVAILVLKLSVSYNSVMVHFDKKIILIKLKDCMHLKLLDTFYLYISFGYTAFKAVCKLACKL